MKLLEGKVALVTGASYGIGFAIASGLAKAGAKIVFNDIKQGRSKTFNVNIYDNGEFVTNEFNFNTNWQDIKYYELKKNNDGSFTLSNLHMNKLPLVIIFTNEEYSVEAELTVNLKASF